MFLDRSYYPFAFVSILWNTRNQGRGSDLWAPCLSLSFAWRVANRQAPLLIGCICLQCLNWQVFSILVGHQIESGIRIRVGRQHEGAGCFRRDEAIRRGISPKVPLALKPNGHLVLLDSCLERGLQYFQIGRIRLLPEGTPEDVGFTEKEVPPSRRSYKTRRPLRVLDLKR